MSIAEAEVTDEKVDDAFIVRALKQADMNALRLALYHQTDDAALADIEVISIPVRGGAFEARVIHRDHHDIIREKAAAYLSDPKRQIKPPPSVEQAKPLMELFQGRTIDDAAFAFGYEDLGFADVPRDRPWKKEIDPKKLDNFEVTIIGTGFSGIAAAVQLDRLGIKSTMIDRYDDIGGTWHVNDYPEARVDVPTFLYQYKFEHDYPWKSFFATQPELLDYINHTVDTYGLRERIELSTEIKSARWDEANKKWTLELQKGDDIETRQSDVVISAAGLFTTPKLPDIEGIENFTGEMFHTTNWNHDFDPTGKKIAVIGTGSTGTQLMPALAEKAQELTVYQRTPNWITPIDGYHAKLTPEQQWLFDTMPGYRNWFIYQQHVGDIWVQNFHEMDPEWIAKGGRVNEKNEKLRENLTAYIHKKVGDKDGLFDKLIPEYAPLARRLVIDNGFYDALMRNNVTLESDGIEEITATGITSVGGTSREFDLIVLGAGFHVSRYFWPVEYQGRDGITLEQLWNKDGARAHKSITLPGFPNFFVIYGPNAQARAGSFHSWVEILSRYIADAIATMIEKDASTIEVKKDAFEGYNKRMDEAMRHILWESEGQGGYYVNEYGRSGVNMPWTMYEFYQMVREIEPDDFTIA